VDVEIAFGMILLKNYSGEKVGYVMKNQEVNIQMYKGPIG
jgi:hypothetical protein